MEKLEEIKEEVSNLLGRLQELHSQNPFLFQFAFLALLRREDGDAKVFESFNIMGDDNTNSLFNALFEVNISLEREIARYRMWTVYPSFKVVCSWIPSPSNLNFDTLQIGARYTVEKHYVDRNNHFLVFIIKDQRGNKVLSPFKHLNHGFPSTLFAIDQSVIGLN